MATQGHKLLLVQVLLTYCLCELLGTLGPSPGLER